MGARSPIIKYLNINNILFFRVPFSVDDASSMLTVAGKNTAILRRQH